jgi:succinate dehydrogenase / fumarate reductase, cytochrome b subunit
MAKRRPVNLNLMSFKFPLPALVSIAHRISGVLMFILMPVILFILSKLLAGGSVNVTILYFSHFPIMLKLLAWVMLVATLYHTLAGLRHLFMDMGYGESFVAANRSAIVIFVLLIVILVATGVWLWA